MHTLRLQQARERAKHEEKKERKKEKRASAKQAIPAIQNYYFSMRSHSLCIGAARACRHAFIHVLRQTYCMYILSL